MGNSYSLKVTENVNVYLINYVYEVNGEAALFPMYTKYIINKKYPPKNHTLLL